MNGGICFITIFMYALIKTHNSAMSNANASHAIIEGFFMMKRLFWSILTDNNNTNDNIKYLTKIENYLLRSIRYT